MENTSKKVELLKENILNKVDEMVDSIVALGREDFFELNIKYIKGEIITKAEFSDKVKIM